MKEYKDKIIKGLMEEVLHRETNAPTGMALDNQMFLTIPNVPEELNPGHVKSALGAICGMVECPADDILVEQDGPSRTFAAVIYSGMRVKKPQPKEERTSPVPTPEEEAALRKPATKEPTAKEIKEDIAAFDDFFGEG